MTQNKRNKDVWTVAEAKARLSEVLRLASANPQYIGAKKSHVIVLAEEWETSKRTSLPMGQSLVGALKHKGEIDFPERGEGNREVSESSFKTFVGGMQALRLSLIHI